MVRNLCHISWSILLLNSVHVCSSKISVVPRIYFCVLRDIILLLTVGLIVRYLQAFQLLLSVSDCEISASFPISGVSVWLWVICRRFKYWCQCLIVRYLQASQLLVSVCDCEISAGLSITGANVWFEISAGLQITSANVWLWDICRPFNYWCQCLIVGNLQAFNYWCQYLI